MDLGSNKSIYIRVEEAYKRINKHIRRTPLEHSIYFSQKTGCNVYLKLESEQITGSNKARGAFNKVLKTIEDADFFGKDVEFHVPSCGNHALAMTHALKITGQKGKIYLPIHAKSSKVEYLKLLGANIHIHGQDIEDTEKFAQNESINRDGIYASSAIDPVVIAGQGTVGLEILQDLEQVNAIFVSVGSGGLIGGISSYIKQVSPNTQIVGCSTARSNCMEQSIEHGKPIDIISQHTLADGLYGNIGLDSITFSICQQNVDRWINVTEKEIAKAMYTMLDVHHKVVEGAAAVALSSFIKVQDEYLGKNIVILICGGNVDMDDIFRVIQRHK